MKAHTFESYRDKYENVRMRREDGILEVALHTRGGPLMFNGYGDQVASLYSGMDLKKNY